MYRPYGAWEFGDPGPIQGAERDSSAITMSSGRKWGRGDHGYRSPWSLTVTNTKSQIRVLLPVMQWTLYRGIIIGPMQVKH